MVAYIDHVSTLECEEQFGAISRIVRRARVRDLSATDYTVLMQALEEAGVPLAGSKLGPAPNCILTTRTAKIVDEDAGTVDVDLTYVSGMNEGQSFDSPPFGGLILGESKASLVQKESNLDRDGNTISVSYTFKSDDPDYGRPGQQTGKTVPQGGIIQYLQPQTFVRYSGLKATGAPWLLQRALIGKTNSGTFQGGEPGTWLCVSCDWRPMDLGSSPNRVFFEIEFQYDPDGWDPSVYFIDPRTGKPPEDITTPDGYRTVQKYWQIDFESVMGSRVQGG